MTANQVAIFVAGPLGVALSVASYYLAHKTTSDERLLAKAAFIIFLICGSYFFYNLLTHTTVSLYPGTNSMVVNGSLSEQSVYCGSSNGHILVSEEVIKAAGGSMDSDNGLLDTRLNGNTIRMREKQKYFELNGKGYDASIAPYRESGRWIIPLQIIAKACEVKYGAGTVTIKCD